MYIEMYNLYKQTKNDYIDIIIQNGGSLGDIDFVIINVIESEIVDPSYDLDKIREHLKKYGNVFDYYAKFISTDQVYTVNDLSFDSVAIDIRNTFQRKIFLICYSHSSPYGLYFADKYPELCEGIICYPLRLYSAESLERRIWKFKDNKGWAISFL